MKNHLIRGWLKPAVGLALISGLAVSGWAQSPKHVLLVSVTKGFRHDVIPTTDDVIADLGKKSGKFDVDYVKTDEDMAAKLDAALEEGDLNLVAAALGLQLHAAPAAPKGAV